MWVIRESGRVIKYPTAVVLNGVHYPATIFTRWSREQLAAIGIYPFRDQQFNKDRYHATSPTDLLVEGVIYRTYVLLERSDYLDNLKIAQYHGIKSAMDKELSEGFTAVVDGISYHMDATEDHIQRLKNGIDAAELSSQTTMVVRDYNNVDHPVTTGTAIEILKQVFSNYHQLWLKKGSKYDAIMSAADTDAVLAVVWSEETE